jgi:hypothetical protein
VTHRPTSSMIAWAVACGVAALGLVGAFVREERASLERGNRFYREGSVERAREIYHARAESDFATAADAYNLGTAMLALGSTEAEDYLRLAAGGVDSAAAQRGNYNLGLLLLRRSHEAEEADIAVSLLTAAVASNRLALRLDPADADARWNLALSQSLLDSMGGLAGLEEPSGEDETDRAEGDEGMVIPQVAQLGPRRGREYEAAAGDDPGSINEAEARALLDDIRTDPEALVRGIMWSLRPDVSPWVEPYPGGNW